MSIPESKHLELPKEHFKPSIKCSWAPDGTVAIPERLDRNEVENLFRQKLLLALSLIKLCPDPKWKSGVRSNIWDKLIEKMVEQKQNE